MYMVQAIADKPNVKLELGSDEGTIADNDTLEDVPNTADGIG